MLDHKWHKSGGVKAYIIPNYVQGPGLPICKHFTEFCKVYYSLALIDVFVCYIWIEAMSESRTFDQFIKIFGLPSRINTDRSKAFECYSFRMYRQDNQEKQINNITKAIISPRANGQIKHFNRIILDALVIYVGDGDQGNWEQY